MASSDPQQIDLDNWAEEVVGGKPRAVAKAISALENAEPQAEALMRRLFSHTGRAKLIGITGASGAGKSTLTDALALRLRKQGRTVGIIAVDPTSPFTGGAVLGDRIRMNNLSGDPGVFIRSLATRGALGGVSATTLDAALVLAASGKDMVLIETVGVGQDEVEIAQLADATVLLLVPSMGDEVQVFKAGIMEIADLFVINKSDLQGADRLQSDIDSLLELAPLRNGEWRPPVIRTVATEGGGVDEMLAALDQFFDFSQSGGSFHQRRIRTWKERIRDALHQRALDAVRSYALRDGLLDEYAAAVDARRQDPYSAADQLWERAQSERQLTGK